YKCLPSSGLYSHPKICSSGEQQKNCSSRPTIRRHHHFKQTRRCCLVARGRRGLGSRRQARRRGPSLRVLEPEARRSSNTNNQGLKQHMEMEAVLVGNVQGGEEEEEEEGGMGAVRRWEDLDNDILVRIFERMDIWELTGGIGLVCSAWRRACCDPLLWKTLDLSMFKSNYIKIPLDPYVYVNGHSHNSLTRLLKLSLSLSCGTITSLFFHFNLYVSDDQLTYTAERCPHLKRLVMPAWNRIKKTGICKAIRLWKDLESLTMPSIANPPYLIEEIANNCRNFSQLKIMGPFENLFASTLVNSLPTLKVLSLRCSLITKEALLSILELQGLEVLNISHCLLIEAPPPPAPRRVMKELDQTILNKAARLREFLTCMDDSCIMCQRTKTDEGIVRWYKYEEGLWKADEIASLALTSDHPEVML
ncbi:hypothetical protein Tsubulata_029408, partial [Turnera subulata]